MPLALLSEKRLSHASVLELVAYSDPHDLIAVATDVGDVIVYRLTGHVAFTIKRTDLEAEITALGWKQDGSVLGVGWSNGAYGMFSGENGKLLSTGSVRDDDDEDGSDDEFGSGIGVTVRGFWWTRYPNSTTASNPESLDAWDDDNLFSNDKPFKDSKDSIEQLTRSIATMDVTNVLPRLSHLPSHGLRAGPDGSRFTSQAATDTVFEGAKQDGSSPAAVDTLIITCSDGAALVLMDDTVQIGRCNVPGVPVMQAANPERPSHAVLSQTEDQQLHLNTLTLPLDTLGGPLLHVIATSTKRLQTLLSYSTHTTRCITHDYTTGLAFPSRLISNMETELFEKQEADLVTELYQLALTGVHTPTMLEWLVDIVKETNHKRWDQAINTMYTNIQTHLFLHLKPALDRLSIATTTLRGYARYCEGSTSFEVEPALFTKVLDGIDSLRIVSQKMLLFVGAEQRQFKAFSKWLRVMIDIGVGGPGSKGALETENRENPNLEYPLILEYIERTMSRSRLARHVETLLAPEQASMDIAGHTVYERTCEALTKLDSLEQDDELHIKGVQRAEAFVNLPAIAAYLGRSIGTALARVTQWQGEMLTLPTSVQLQVEPGTKVLDMQVGRSEPGQPAVARMLLLLEDSQQLVLISEGTEQSATVLDFDDVADAKFTALGLIVLHRQDGGYLLGEGSRSRAPLHVVQADANFTPERLLVGGREGIRVCFVLGSGGRSWRAFDLSQQGMGQDDDEEMMTS